MRRARGGRRTPALLASLAQAGRRVRLPLLVAGLLAAALALPVPAQTSREAERKLETVKRELKDVAAQRLRLQGQRGDVSQQLRAADEQVGQTNRRLRDTETRLASDQATLAQLQQQRAAMQQQLGDKRAQLQGLLRAAYAQGHAAPLKALLAQDRVADAGRVLTYHRYLQRDRAQRIAGLTRDLQAVETLHDEIASRQQQLDSARGQQRQQLAQLEAQRRQRAELMAQIDAQYQDKASREQALGRDARNLEQVLRQLRVAAARAQAARRAAAAKAAREARLQKSRDAAAGRDPAVRPPRRAASVATAAPAPQVGGLGWPVSGALLAGFGARMPDGRSSEGLLIGAGAGSTVKAVADGSVVYAEWMTGYGLLLIVDHGNGYMSLYAHNDALLKDVGARVHRGDAVSTVGSSGGQGRPALYFELRRNGQPVNPGSWLRQ